MSKENCNIPSSEEVSDMIDPLHQFAVSPLLKLEFCGVDLSFTNSSLRRWRWIQKTWSCFSVYLECPSLHPTRLITKATSCRDFSQSLPFHSLSHLSNFTKDSPLTCLCTLGLVEASLFTIYLSVLYMCYIETVKDL